MPFNDSLFNFTKVKEKKALVNARNGDLLESLMAKYNNFRLLGPQLEKKPED
jgi:hypothetical protein